ncbi:hypothetical protein BGX28_004930 [Mortierella sp. GBA30]|nr:hypothetical protein BGX28_004930 [Mortierella sp. GBA30]
MAIVAMTPLDRTSTDINAAPPRVAVRPDCEALSPLHKDFVLCCLKQPLLKLQSPMPLASFERDAFFLHNVSHDSLQQRPWSVSDAVKGMAFCDALGTPLLPSSFKATGTAFEDNLFPAHIFHNDYGRTIRMLLDPHWRLLAAKQVDVRFVQDPVVVMMMTRGRTAAEDQFNTQGHDKHANLKDTGCMKDSGFSIDEEELLPRKVKDNLMESEKRSFKRRSSKAPISITESRISGSSLRKRDRKRRAQEHSHCPKSRETSASIVSSTQSSWLTSPPQTGTEAEGSEQEVSVKSGRWSSAEDKALFRGVQLHLAAHGLEPQPPAYLPAETTFREQQRVNRRADIDSEHRSKGDDAVQHELLADFKPRAMEIVTDDMKLFDSIVDASYYTDGMDRSSSSADIMTAVAEKHSLLSTPISLPSETSSRHSSLIDDNGNNQTLAPGLIMAPVASLRGTKAVSHSGLQQSSRPYPPSSQVVAELDPDSLSHVLPDALTAPTYAVEVVGKQSQSTMHRDATLCSINSEHSVHHNAVLQSTNVCALSTLPAHYLAQSPLTLSRSVMCPPSVQAESGLPRVAAAITQNVGLDGSMKSSEHMPYHHTTSVVQEPFSAENISKPHELLLTQPGPSMLMSHYWTIIPPDQGPVAQSRWYPQPNQRLVPNVSVIGSLHTQVPDGSFSNNSSGYIDVFDSQDEYYYASDLNRDGGHSFRVNTRYPLGQISQINGVQYRYTDLLYSLPQNYHPMYPRFTPSPSTRHSYLHSPVSFSLPSSSLSSPRLASSAQSLPAASCILGPNTNCSSITLATSAGGEIAQNTIKFDSKNNLIYNSAVLNEAKTSSAPLSRHISQTQESYSLAISRAMASCPWNVITRGSIPGRTGVQAQARWSEALDPQVKKGKWTPEEDALLLKGVQENQKCWIRIADGIPGRTQRQCRTRWVQISTRAERDAAAAAVAIVKEQHQQQQQESRVHDHWDH